MGRRKIINRFEATVMTTYSLPDTLVDQWLIMSVDDYIHFVDTDLTYTPDESDPSQGVFNRDLIPGEIEVLSLGVDYFYTMRDRDGIMKVISTDTKMGRNSGLDGRRKAYDNKLEQLETKIQTLYSQLANFLKTQATTSNS